MVMVADSIPGLKRWISTLGLKDSAKFLVIRVVVAFLLHAGRMSCLQTAGAVRCEARHRAQISRYLARPRRRKLDINSILRQKLLEREACDGLFVFIIDATSTSQAGKKTENTYSTGNRQRRPRKGRRYGKNKHAQKNCTASRWASWSRRRACGSRSASRITRESTARRLVGHTAPQPRRQPI